MESLRSSVEESLELSDNDEESTHLAKSAVEPTHTLDPIRPTTNKQVLNRPVTIEVEMNKESTIEYRPNELDKAAVAEIIVSQTPVPEIPLSRAIQSASSASIFKAPVMSIEEYEEDETLNTEQIVRDNLSILKDDQEVGAVVDVVGGARGENASMLKTFTVTSLSMARQNVLDENILSGEEEIAGEAGGIIKRGRGAHKQEFAKNSVEDDDKRDEGIMSDEHEQNALTLVVSSTDLGEENASGCLKLNKLDSYACPREVIETSETNTCQLLESLDDKTTIERISTQQVRIIIILLL